MARTADQKHILYRLLSCSAIKTEVGEEEWENKILLLPIHPEPNIAKNLPDNNLSVMVSHVDWNG